MARGIGRRTAVVATVATAVVAAATGGGASAAQATEGVAGAPSRIVVRAGESVQAAIDAVRAGGTVVVPAGTYREDLLITKPLTIRGERGAVLTRADDPADTLCNADEEAADAGLEIQVGVCVLGQLGDPVPGDGDLPTVVSPVPDVRIEGLTLDGFDEGVESVGTRDLRLSRLTVTGSRDGGILGWYGAGTSVQDCTLAGGLGFAALSLRRSTGSAVTANRVVGNAGFGIALADDVEVRVSANTVRDNAGGLVAWDSGDLGTTGDMRGLQVTGNDVSANSRVFGGDGPSFGRVGVLMAGVTGSTVAGNRVRDNGPGSAGAFFSGIGIGLLDAADLFGGGAAGDVRIVGNTVTGSSTPVLVQASGQGVVVRGNREVAL